MKAKRVPPIICHCPGEAFHVAAIAGGHVGLGVHWCPECGALRGPSTEYQWRLPMQRSLRLEPR